ncbi:ABC transporter ATP-binding protein [Nocardia pseudobrasiliensis]|uniref:Oligopeptide/dipeptide transporter n=1 Tax=Nocardia pseudobrasiliensis TaxID=45979 RepID=A0A370HP98_9NOCA|nr:ATP-binding cassette domain-containing protein [Nocardia pseudobrasiliensis]RDI60338.1 oligopeptide/dipeptide transporter [Nocardia pseudobrasiliensis]
MTLLEAEGLNRSYRLPRTGFREPRRMRHAVRDVGLTLEEGSHLGIVGESGSGKSTLLRLLLALDRPDSGEVRYRGRAVAGRDLHGFRREVQVVLQDPLSSLNPQLSVGHSIAEPLRCLRVPGDHRQRVAELLMAVGMEPDAARRYPHQFSGGQRQRIAIARALAPDPKVLVGDEPFSALDIPTRAQIMGLLKGLADRLGLTLIIVSHDMAVVQSMCDRLLVLKDGVVVERGEVGAILERPEHPYTRTLLEAVPVLPF